MVNAETVLEDPDDGTDEPDTAEPTDSAEPEDTATPDTSDPNQAPIADAGQDRQVVVGRWSACQAACLQTQMEMRYKPLAAPQRTSNSDPDGTTATPEITFTSLGQPDRPEHL